MSIRSKLVALAVTAVSVLALSAGVVAPAHADTNAMIVPASGTVYGQWHKYCDNAPGGYDHNGVDISNAAGGPIWAAAAGTVVASSYSGTLGNRITIDHGAGWRTVYAHLKTGTLIANGTHVSQGQQIAQMGNTGGNYAVHLHFETWYNGASQQFVNNYFTCFKNVVRGTPIPLNYPGLDGGTATSSLPLMQVYAGSGWQQGYTGIDFTGASDISAIYMGGTWPTVMAIKDNTLYQIYGSETEGWQANPTNVTFSPGASISAVNFNGTIQVMATDNNTVYQIYPDYSAGQWVKASTGIQASGQISSVVVPGSNWPTSIVSVGGALHLVWADSAGWHIGNTGVTASGRISAVLDGGNLPQVYSVENGLLYQTFAGPNGWVKISTGLGANGAPSALKVGNTLEVIVTSNGQLYQAYYGSNGWASAGGLGIASSNLFSAVYLGGDQPQIMKLG